MKPKTCLSLSGRATLSYVVEGDSLAIVGNSNTGLFDPTPVCLSDIEKAIAANDGQATTKALQGLFKGKSRNTAGFVLAALRDMERSST